ncbi:MAG: SRPBCC family protein [Acidithiobacillus sp.]
MGFSGGRHASRRGWMGWLVSVVLTLCPVPVLAAKDPGLQIEVQHTEGSFAVHAVFPVPVSPARAFAVMTDYEHMAQFIPQMRKSQVLWRNGERESVLQEGSVDLLWLHIPTYVVMSVHLLPDRAVHFHSSGGSMAVSGQAEIRPLAGGSLVDYRASLKPGTVLPLAFAQGSVTRYIRQQMEALRTEMLRAP